MKLNTQQRKAVTHTQGPLLIIAGAGTGKTTVITKRIEYLITKMDIAPNQIASLTFTDKAANEMVERLDNVMPLGYEEPWISTFHGFCDRILRVHALEIGLSPDYQILSSAEQWLLLKQHLFDLELEYYAPLGTPNKFIHALLTFFSRLQDEDVSETDIDNFLANQTQDSSPQEQARLEEVFRAYHHYSNLKRSENVLDFGDLIAWTLRLFRSRAHILHQYRNQFMYILVDEFQDTNFAQLQLIKLLAPPAESPNLTVVGDDDQAIYAFRGSSVFNILDFKSHYPQAKEVLLTTNYRSGQPILHAAYHSIQHNNPDRLEHKLKIDKRLVAARGSSTPKPTVIHTKQLIHEAEFVVEKILHLVGKQYTYKDFAILARANNHLDICVSALRRAGIPYQLIGNRGLFDQDEIRDLLFFLRVCKDTQDSMSVFQLLHLECLDLESEHMLSMLADSQKRSTSLWSILQEQSSSHTEYQRIIAMVERAQADDTHKPICEILHAFLAKSQFITSFLQEKSIEDQLRIKNVNLFLEKVVFFDTQHPRSSISECVDYFDLLMEAGENPAQAEIEDIDTVNLLTIHASKGLEWPVVFIINLVSDRFPTRNRRDPIEIPETFVKQSKPTGNFHIQEERRLFYVALTRARDYLYLIHADDYGGKRLKKASGFVQELLTSKHQSEQKKPLVKTQTWQPTSQQLSWLDSLESANAPQPQKIMDGSLELTHVSYSQIDDYKSCPLKYKYKYILKVPTAPHHAFSFGTTIHSVLQRFHAHQIQGQTPSQDDMLTHYTDSFKELGYESAQHKQQRYKAGKHHLSQYYQTYKQSFSGKPVMLEKSFRVIINNIPLIGRIDRIDVLDKNYTVKPGTQTLPNDVDFEVIDYKTGRAKDQKTVDRDAQLTIYAMAAQAIFGRLPTQLSLYFIDGNIKVTTTRTLAQVKKKQTQIHQSIDQIRSGDFSATPGKPMPCTYCSYNSICPFAV